MRPNLFSWPFSDHINRVALHLYIYFYGIEGITVIIVFTRHSLKQLKLHTRRATAVQGGGRFKMKMALDFLTKKKMFLLIRCIFNLPKVNKKQTSNL